MDIFETGTPAVGLYDVAQQEAVAGGPEKAPPALSLWVMRTVVIGPNADVDEIIARRRAYGQDLHDEVWEGEYHMAPAPSGAHALLQARLLLLLEPFAEAAGLISSAPFNLGSPGDYRVPGGGYHRVEPQGVWHDTAAIVVEIVSPDDETYAKFDFYAAHGVGEIIVADPTGKTVRCFHRTVSVFHDPAPATGSFIAEQPESKLLGVGVAELTASIRWP